MKRTLCLLLTGIVLASFFSCSKKPDLPGLFSGGTRLPNRWVLTPAGTQIPIGELPLNMVLSPDGSTLAVTNNGYGRQFISLIDAQQQQKLGELEVKKAFFGLAFSPDGKHLYASGGADDQILVWRLEGKTAMPEPAIDLKKKMLQPEIVIDPGVITLADPKTMVGSLGASPKFPAGLAISSDGATLYVAENRDSCLAIIHLQSGEIETRILLGAHPYDVKLSQDGKTAFVSLWGASRLAIVDAAARKMIVKIRVGDHPNAMQLAPDGKTLFIACANTDEVWVIDSETHAVLETIGLPPYPNAPFGSTPNGLAISPDGKTLYVANADNNDVAVIDISRPGHSVVKGLIPVGWYPTAVAVSADGNNIFVANGKGLSSAANPKGPNPNEKRTEETQYIGRMFSGTVSVIPVPDGLRLAEYTKQVAKNNGFNEAAQKLIEKGEATQAHAIPRRVGEPSLIKHVIYIIKENRTYDQVLGDLPQGNGDPNICLFDREVTPNHHALAETFVLLDNFYVNAEVSADGHEWSTGAIATDFVEKTWPTSYSGRGLPYPSEGNFRIAFPTSGYIWEAAARRGVSYRSYGEFIDLEKDSVFSRHPALEGHYDPLFRPWDLDYPDTLRAAEFIRELHEFEKSGDFPRFTIMRLPNDHTSGTKPGAPTPRAMVADNDLAFGQVVEAMSRSKFWPQTAIFVVEDDAQNGPDHVDAHRSTAYAISPYIRRGMVDNSMYDTVSMLRTMELILGLPPLSQYDAAALPMFACFSDKPDLTPYTALRPQVPMDERNSNLAYGAEESLAMNFSREDATPEIRLNEIIWKSVRGVDSVMPKPINHSSREESD